MPRLRVIRIFDATRRRHAGADDDPRPYEDVHEDYEARQREGLDEAVAALPSDVQRRGRCSSPVRPGHELAAQSEHVDLMVVGSRGYGPRAAVLLGGVTHTLDPQGGVPRGRPAPRLARARGAVRGAHETATS